MIRPAHLLLMSLVLLRKPAARAFGATRPPIYVPHMAVSDYVFTENRTSASRIEC